jgi:hypothetical protein
MTTIDTRQAFLNLTKEGNFTEAQADAILKLVVEQDDGTVTKTFLDARLATFETAITNRLYGVATALALLIIGAHFVK